MAKITPPAWNAAEQEWLPALVFAIGQGSAALAYVGTGSTWRSYVLDAASQESVITGWVVPRWWSTFDVSLYWTNAGAGSGDVQWQLVSDSYAEGATLAATTAATAVTVTAPAQNVLKITTLASGLAVTAGAARQLTVRRVAADVADTLANDAAVIGVLLRRAS